MTLSPLVTKEVAIIRFQTLESDFNKIHNFKYDYSKVVYLNIKSNIKIICPIHGEFTQIADGHLSGKGCRKCAGMYKPTSLEFIDVAKSIHKDKYDYSKTMYLNAKSKIIIICPIHGEFLQTPSGHLSGRGCRKCVGKYKPTLEEFISSAKDIHKDKYDYSKFIYTSKDKVGVIKCNTCGNVFKQSPHNHVYHKKGCKVCSALVNRSKYFNRPTILYYVTFTFNSNLYYKIGITSYSIEKRFSTELNNIVESKSILFSNGKEAYEVEQHILNKFKEFRYEGEALIRGGNTEIFIVDIWEDIAEYFNGG